MMQRGGRMSYLGVIRGSGTLLLGTEELGRADYDLDGFLSGGAEVVASGEICLDQAALSRAMGRSDVQLRTDDGRMLQVRFSPQRNGASGRVAHADVGGELPAPREWRR